MKLNFRFAEKSVFEFGLVNHALCAAMRSLLKVSKPFCSHVIWLGQALQSAYGSLKTWKVLEKKKVKIQARARLFKARLVLIMD